MKLRLCRLILIIDYDTVVIISLLSVTIIIVSLFLILIMKLYYFSRSSKCLIFSFCY